MILLSFIMCGVCGWALWAARRAGINGFVQRYLLMLFLNSLAGTLSLLLVSPQNPYYGAVYIAALIPLLAAICVLSIGWLWKMEKTDRWLVFIVCVLQAAFACLALSSRASVIWSAGIPWQVASLIVQYGVLSSAGIAVLASEHCHDEQYRPTAHLLGTFWFVQGIEKALFASGFAYRWNTWLELSQWLPQVVVVGFVVGLLFKFKAVEFAVSLQRISRSARLATR